MPDISVPWHDGVWTHPPVSIHHDADSNALHVVAESGSDAWLHTAYGFVHDSAHALLAPLPVGGAMDVSFRGDWHGQFDQAGLFVAASEERWVKAGVEFADGHLGLGAVVTAGASDWSIGRVDEWIGAELTVRISRWADALIVRARATDQEWRLVRVAPFPADAVAAAGPFLAAPTRAGLEVVFTRWVQGDADATLH